MQDPRLISRICQMYFIQRMSKVEIADRMRLSRFQVARIIDNAFKDGYVSVQILEPEPLHSKLATQLEYRFGLKIAVIIDDAGLEGSELKHQVAYAAGRYLIEILKDGDVLGISLGTTIQAMVESLPNHLNIKVSVVQLLGGGPGGNTEASSQSLTLELAKKFESEPAFLFAPAFVDNPEVKKALLTDGHIQSIYSKYKTLTIAVAGIGAISTRPSSMLVKSGAIDQNMLYEFVKRGFVGDILAYLYDENGNVVQSGLEDRTIAIPLEDFLNTPYRLGIATGNEKVKAIIGALKGGFLTALITDNCTAKAVLDFSETKEKSKYTNERISSVEL